MDQQVKVKSLTSTHEAVMVTVGAIGAFFIGVSMVFTLPSLTKVVFGPIPAEPVPVQTPMQIADITGITLASDATGVGANQLTITGLSSTGNVTFGYYDWQGVTNGFIDGSTAPKPLPVAVTLDSNNNSAMMITFQTGIYDQTGTPSCYDTDPRQYPGLAGEVGGVDENGERYTYADICNPKNLDELVEYQCITNPDGQGMIPDEVTSTCPEGCAAGACLYGADGSEQSNLVSLLGIPTAHAQVTIGQKYTICVPQIENDPVIHTPITYYADINGNLYFDRALSRRVSTAVDCQAQIAKNYSPNDITAVTSSDQFVFGESNHVVMFKTWDTPLGFFNSEDGLYDYDFDAVGSTAPLVLVSSFNENDLEGSIPEQTLTVTSDLGTKALCYPETERTPNQWYAYFYDVNGNPYSDVMLHERISCGNTYPSCGPCMNSPKDPLCCSAVGAGL